MEDPVFGRLLLSTPSQKCTGRIPRTLWAGTAALGEAKSLPEARAAEIAAYKKKHPEGGWPGVVTVVQDEGVGAVVDGQHRLRGLVTIQGRFITQKPCRAFWSTCDRQTLGRGRL